MHKRSHRFERATPAHPHRTRTQKPHNRSVVRRTATPTPKTVPRLEQSLSAVHGVLAHPWSRAVNRVRHAFALMGYPFESGRGSPPPVPSPRPEGGRGPLIQADLAASWCTRLGTQSAQRSPRLAGTAHYQDPGTNLTQMDIPFALKRVRPPSGTESCFHMWASLAPEDPANGGTLRAARCRCAIRAAQGSHIGGTRGQGATAATGVSLLESDGDALRSNRSSPPTGSGLSRMAEASIFETFAGCRRQPLSFDDYDVCHHALTKRESSAG